MLPFPISSPSLGDFQIFSSPTRISNGGCANPSIMISGNMDVLSATSADVRCTAFLNHQRVNDPMLHNCQFPI